MILVFNWFTRNNNNYWALFTLYEVNKCVIQINKQSSWHKFTWASTLKVFPQMLVLLRSLCEHKLKQLLLFFPILEKKGKYLPRHFNSQCDQCCQNALILYLYFQRSHYSGSIKSEEFYATLKKKTNSGWKSWFILRIIL